MNEEPILCYLISFMLGYLLSRHMSNGNGFSIGNQEKENPCHIPETIRDLSNPGFCTAPDTYGGFCRGNGSDRGGNAPGARGNGGITSKGSDYSSLKECYNKCSISGSCLGISISNETEAGNIYCKMHNMCKAGEDEWCDTSATKIVDRWNKVTKNTSGVKCVEKIQTPEPP
jgi:hypothetical protein